MLLGDLVAQVTQKIGIKSCIPCKARQSQMNQWHSDLQVKIKNMLNKPSSGSSESSS